MNEAVFCLETREDGTKAIVLHFDGLVYADPAFDDLLCIRRIKQGWQQGEPYFVLVTNYGEEGFYFGEHESPKFPRDAYAKVSAANVKIEEVIKMTPFMVLNDFNFYVRFGANGGGLQVEVHDIRGGSKSRALFAYNNGIGKFDERQSTFSKDSKRFWEAKYLVERNTEFFVEKVNR